LKSQWTAPNLSHFVFFAPKNLHMRGSLPLQPVHPRLTSSKWNIYELYVPLHDAWIQGCINGILLLAQAEACHCAEVKNVRKLKITYPESGQIGDCRLAS